MDVLVSLVKTGKAGKKVWLKWKAKSEKWKVGAKRREEQGSRNKGGAKRS